MTSSTWKVSPSSGSDNYNISGNWVLGKPGENETAFFGTSNVISVSIATTAGVGEWIFNPVSSQYHFAIGAAASFIFTGAGIVVNGGHVEIDNSSGLFEFFNNSTVGTASITNEPGGSIVFVDASTCGSSVIRNEFGLLFFSNSSSANAVIDTGATGVTVFHDFSNGGSAHSSTLIPAARSISPSQQAPPTTTRLRSVRSPEAEPTNLEPISLLSD
jgi:hypothetical protein